MKKFSISISAFFLSAVCAYSQHEFSVFTATGRAGVATTFATDYQAIGINPANLGLPGVYPEKKIALGFLESSSSIYTSALQSKELRESVFGFGSANFTYQQQVEAASKFVSNGFVINSDITLVGFHVAVEKFGGIGFSVRDRFQWNSNFSQNTADVLFLGYNANYVDFLKLKSGAVVPNSSNLDPSVRDSVEYGYSSNPKKASDLLRGTTVKFSYLREYNVSYGRNIMESESLSIYGGIGIKYIQALGEINIDGDNIANSYSSLSPAFGVDYGEAQKNNPNALSGSGLKPIGRGMGFDFGITAVIKERLKIGASLINLGSITLDKNLYSFKDSDVDTITSSGFDSYNIFLEAQQLSGEGGLIQWEAMKSKKSSLPAMIRVGGSLRLGEKLEIGADVIMPANDAAGNFDKTIIAFGGDILPIPFLKISSGFVYGGNFESSLNIPLGITVIAGSQGSYEFGVATRDIYTYFAQQGPTLSFALGFLRFRV